VEEKVSIADERVQRPLRAIIVANVVSHDSKRVPAYRILLASFLRFYGEAACVALSRKLSYITSRNRREVPGASSAGPLLFTARN
jgi:hypothetical protein